MSQVSTEAFTADPSLDAVQVNEHAGWFLTYLRDGTIVDTANDQAHSMTKPRSFSGASTVTTRREKFAVHERRHINDLRLTPPMSVSMGRWLSS